MCHERRSSSSEITRDVSVHARRYGGSPQSRLGFSYSQLSFFSDPYQRHLPHTESHPSYRPITRMSSPSPQAARHRGGQGKKRATNADAGGAVNGNVDHSAAPSTPIKGLATEGRTSEWDYKLALAIITVLALATRFYGITHPDQVVFDEVHFGKVSNCFV